MIRLLPLVLLFIAALVFFGYMLKLLVEARVKSEKQKQLARFAPELLEHADIPAPLASMFIELKQQNSEAAQIMHDVLHKDRYFGANDMENWLEKHEKKELPK
jgi:uncharacterized protein YccT (UPF0319 family)